MTDDLELFRGKVREFVAWMCKEFPESTQPTSPDHPRAEVDPEIVRRYRTAQYDAGLAGLTWPREYGGQGLTREYQAIAAEEYAGLQQPGWRATLVAHGMCGPTILAFGTEEQKQRYIRPMLRGEEIWCQFFSEPGAGSDLAGLRTRARLEGDTWRVDGQKIWSSHARIASFGVLLARTNPDVPKHRGITMFVVPTDAAGLEIRPIRQINGGAEFNEAFFDDVRIPASAALGGVDDGWRTTQYMLMNERTSITESGGRSTGLDVAGLGELARRAGVADNAWARSRTAQVWARERALELLAEDIADRVKAGSDPGPVGSVAKLMKAQIERQLVELSVDLAGATGGYFSTPQIGGKYTGLTTARATAIAGGTNEIQRNIIAERVLGLPRDDLADRDVPFRDLAQG